jgi:phage gp36-like protein
MKTANLLLIALGTAVLGKTLLDISQAITARKESELLFLEKVKNNNISVTIDRQGNKIFIFADLPNN